MTIRRPLVLVDGQFKQLPTGDTLEAAQEFFSLVTVTATAAEQTSFTVPNGYTPGAVVVFLNGAQLAPIHYTATNGTSVELESGEGVAVGAELVVLRLSTFEVADALPLGGTAADSSKLGGILPTAYLNDALSKLTRAEVGVAAAATLTATAFGCMHVCSGTTVDYTVTLPEANGNAGKIIGVRMASSLTKFVTIAGADSDLIDGKSARVMWTNESAALLCTGTGWTKIAGKTVPMSCIAYAAADQTLSPSVVTAVPLRLVASDPARLHDAVNGRINIKRPGAYFFSGSVYFRGTTSGTLAYTQTRVHFNGGQIAGGTTINTTQIPAYGVSFNPLNTTLLFDQAGYAQLMGYFDNSGTPSPNRTTYSGTVDFTNLKMTELPSW
jgi:hypothetical protein